MVVPLVGGSVCLFTVENPFFPLLKVFEGHWPSRSVIIQFRYYCRLPFQTCFMPLTYGCTLSRWIGASFHCWNPLFAPVDDVQRPLTFKICDNPAMILLAIAFSALLLALVLMVVQQVGELFFFSLLPKPPFCPSCWWCSKVEGHWLSRSG